MLALAPLQPSHPEPRSPASSAAEAFPHYTKTPEVSRRQPADLDDREAQMCEEEEPTIGPVSDDLVLRSPAFAKAPLCMPVIGASPDRSSLVVNSIDVGTQTMAAEMQTKTERSPPAVVASRDTQTADVSPSLSSVPLCALLAPAPAHLRPAPSPRAMLHYDLMGLKHQLENALNKVNQAISVADKGE